MKPRKAKKANPAPPAAPPVAKVLVLRTCNADMTSYGGFKWPASGPVEAPDWKADAKCGNGLHGWLWGAGDWSLKSKDADCKWLVMETDKDGVIELGGKVKFQKCEVLFVSARWSDAMAFLRGRASIPNIASATGYSGHASATGHYGHASATGHYGHASATGHYGHASATGDSGHASATGDSGHASATGNSGHASATGYSGHASATGHYGWAISNRGTAKAGKDGIISIRYKDAGGKYRVATGYVGENGIKPNTPYSVSETGVFEEVSK